VVGGTDLGGSTTSLRRSSPAPVGVLLEGAPRSSLVAAVGATAPGDATLERSVVRRLAAYLPEEATEIAHPLHVSETTVKTHIGPYNDENLRQWPNPTLAGASRRYAF
jgi:hypothetical protein